MMCWASTSRAPARSGLRSRAFSAIASRAAWHSSISKRLAGTKRAWLASSSRWLARPIRWTMREAPLGEASWMTRSTSPQSMPRSRVEVQTTARSSPRRHGRLDLAPLFGGQRAVVQGDGQVVLVQPPQLLEGELGLEAGVDEHQRGPGAADGVIDLGHGVAGGVAGPGHAVLGEQHVHHRRRAGRAAHQVDRRRDRLGVSQRRMHVRIVHRGREARPGAWRGANCCRRARPRASRSPRLEGQMAWISSMITHSQVLEIAPRAFPGAEQGQLLGRGEQDVGRLDPLALASRDAGVAGAGLGHDLQAHLA